MSTVFPSTETIIEAMRAGAQWFYITVPLCIITCIIGCIINRRNSKKLNKVKKKRVVGKETRNKYTKTQTVDTEAVIEDSNIKDNVEIDDESKAGEVKDETKYMGLELHFDEEGHVK